MFKLLSIFALTIFALTSRADVIQNKNITIDSNSKNVNGNKYVNCTVQITNTTLENDNFDNSSIKASSDT